MLKFVLHEELEGRNGGIPFHMFTSHALNPLCLSPLNIIYEIKANSAYVKLMFILFFCILCISGNLYSMYLICVLVLWPRSVKPFLTER